MKISSENKISYNFRNIYQHHKTILRANISIQANEDESDCENFVFIYIARELCLLRFPMFLLKNGAQKGKSFFRNYI